MSDYVEVKTELFYQGPYNSNPTGLDTFTTEASLMASFPLCIIPAGFFRFPGKCLRVKASGVLSSTGSPTFTWTLRLLTSSTWSAGGLSWTTGALTAANNASSAPWALEFDLWSYAYSSGANTSLRGSLELRTVDAITAHGKLVDGAVTTFNADVPAYLFLSAACGTSNMSNAITLTQMKAYGEN